MGEQIEQQFYMAPLKEHSDGYKEYELSSGDRSHRFKINKKVNRGMLMRLSIREQAKQQGSNDFVTPKKEQYNEKAPAIESEELKQKSKVLLF